MASNQMLALLGLLAVAGYQNRDKIGGMLSQITGGGPASGTGATGGTAAGSSGYAGPSNGGGLGGLLGGLFGGGSPSGTSLQGGGVSNALNDLIDHFSSHGHGDTARSWVQDGPNGPVAPTQLEQALGDDTIQQLMKQTGLSRDDLLSRLSQVLPTAVDSMTPQGRVPTQAEAARWTV